MKTGIRVLALLLLLSMLAGCGGGGSAGEGNHHPSETEPETNTTDGTDPPAGAPDSTQSSTTPEDTTVQQEERANYDDIFDPLRGKITQSGQGESPWEEFMPFDLNGSKKRMLNKNQQYEANLFLSNFAEQSFGNGFDQLFYTEDAKPMELVEFAFLHSILNGDMIGTDGCAYMTISQINAITGRYLDRWISASDISGETYTLEDGKVRMDVPEGERHLQVAVTQGMWQKPDGNYVAAFAIYELDPKYDTDKSVYYLTPETVEDVKATLCCYGVALLKPYHHLNTYSYQLLAYQLLKESFIVQ